MATNNKTRIYVSIEKNGETIQVERYVENDETDPREYAAGLKAFVIEITPTGRGPL